MTFSRRKVLSLIGGGTVLAAGGASAGFLSTRTPHAAFAPWGTAGTYSDPRKSALSYALLAPNAHNRQPWLIGLEEADTVTIWRDTERELPQTDPYQRQLVISLGCFLEQMRIAAAQDGLAVTLDIYPEGETGPVAVARFGGVVQPDPLFAAILERRSCREPFADRALKGDHADALASYAKIFTDAKTVARIKDVTLQAWQIEAHHAPAMNETIDLMRFGKAEINKNPDGISLGGPLFDSLILAGMLSREGQRNRDSNSFKQGVKAYENMLHATPAHAVITTTGNTRADQIEAGRRWLRLNLAATLLGVSLHPVSQALQEFPEMSEMYQQAHELLANEGETVQMLGRLGYGPKTPRSPRWPLETRLI